MPLPPQVAAESAEPMDPTGSARPPAGSTRERILDIALALFTERGYDGTSIRAIAAELGTTGAALYYHFDSKADILLELHQRLRGVGQHLLGALEALPPGEARARAWPGLVDEFITAVDAQRDLVQLYLRTQHTVEVLRAEGRHVTEDDISRRLSHLLDASDLPAAVRVRVACSIGAVTEGLLSDGLVADVPPAERVELVRAAVADLFRGR